MVMKSYRNNKTTITTIANYWKDNNQIDECRLNFDWDECEHHCWNCGLDAKSKTDPRKIRLDRCHIIPHSLGGLDIADNYVLLCKECHSNAPNCTDKNKIWEWIISNKKRISLSGTYKIENALILFKKRRKYSFLTIFNKIQDIDLVNEIVKEQSKTIQTHFNKFNEETYYALLCNIYDRLNK
jgi:heterodisulfide reductase subunit C